MNNKFKTLSICIMSGKGGVGKTNIALNLAYVLYNLGNPVMLMDCDMGLANLDVLLGVSPERNLEDLLQPEINPEGVLVSLEKDGFDFLPAASGVPELVEWDDDLQSVLFQKLNKNFLQYNYLLLDLGAGLNSTVITLASMSQIKCVVISPEPTSLTDSYALIKVLLHQKQVHDFQVIVNMAKNRQEGEDYFNRLKTACEKFLGVKVNLLGVVREDENMVQAVIKQIPLSKLAPNSNSFQDIQALAFKIKKLRQKLLPDLVEPLQSPLINLK